MNKFNQYKLLIGICALPLVASCDYEEVNTNPFEVTDEMGNRDNIAVGSSLTAMARQVIPVGTAADRTDIINEYQTAVHLSADIWSGYFSENNNWNSGNNHMTYYLNNAWVASTYNSTYTKAFAPWKKIKKNVEATGATDIFSLAQILKISSWVKTLETFGPIPYSHADDASLIIPFDSEKEAYETLFKELKEAIDLLTPKAESGAVIAADFDPIYGGDVKSWVKYANSLMLRTAIHLKFVDEAMSKQWVKTALDHKMGVMTAKSDEAQISNGAGYSFINNISYLASQYNECRMGTTIYSYLNGYKDPRLSKYFSVSNSKHALKAFDGKFYAPVPSGHEMKKGEYDDFSLPNMTEQTPTYWMRASEVYFLRAEAALQWPEFGSAEELYKQGIQMSFEENGLSAGEASKYETSTGKPVPVTISSDNNAYSAPAPTQATPSFEGSNEEKLEKIIIQKWIAMYPNGQEAWTEWRRTGYPKMNEVQHNNGFFEGITPQTGIRRMIYPESFSKTTDPDKLQNYRNAVDKLSNKTDGANTRLWWDVRR